MPPSDCNGQFRERNYYFDSLDGRAHVYGVLLYMSERCLRDDYRDEGVRLWDNFRLKVCVSRIIIGCVMHMHMSMSMYDYYRTKD